jgi:hypothetical protein
MTIEQLGNLCNAQPFQPFVMHLDDGQQIPVQHREFMATAPSGRTVVVYQPDETMNIVDLLLVTDLDVKPASNGSGKKRKA